jgi:hypothetical protein
VYHVKATEPGTYALEVYWGGVLPKVEESTATNAVKDQIMVFTVAILPFRIVWWSDIARAWLPASQKMEVFPNGNCVPA